MPTRKLVKRKNQKAKNGNRLRPGEKLAIIAATTIDPSIARVSRAFGVAENTIRRILAKKQAAMIPDSDFDTAGKIFSTMLLSNAIVSQESIDSDSFEKMNPVQRAVFTKINIEASRLLREKPTKIHQHNSVTDLAAETMDSLKKRLDFLDDIVPTQGEIVESDGNTESVDTQSIGVPPNAP